MYKGERGVSSASYISAPRPAQWRMGRFKLQPQINNVESDSIFLVHIPAIGFFPETAQLSFVFGLHHCCGSGAGTSLFKYHWRTKRPVYIMFHLLWLCSERRLNSIIIISDTSQKNWEIRCGKSAYIFLGELDAASLRLKSRKKKCPEQ